MPANLLLPLAVAALSIRLAYSSALLHPLASNAATLEARSASVEASPSSQYYLQPVAVNANQASKFHDQYLDTFHTGAGMNAVTSGTEKRLLVELRDTSIIYQEPQLSEPFTLGLRGAPPGGNTAPLGYRYISFDVTDTGTPGFSRNAQTGAITYHGPMDLCSFAVCNVSTISFSDEIGPDLELLYRDSLTIPNDEQCSDVTLVAVPSAT
ncbi:MAG: hypothetical protein M1828_006650 [Chrysothrix sp. TS-e1954]|nr:MAG: hypothetical protein M1828_006650 [Chrysothrix sp. TS-e1954]